MRVEEKIAVLLVAIAILFHVFSKGFLPESGFSLGGNLLNVVFSFFAVYATLAAYVSAQYDREYRYFWLFMHAGFLLWFLGDVAWLVQEVFLNLYVPFPSISDVFWIIGYPFLIIALLRWFGKSGLGETRLSQFNIVLGVIIAVLISLFLFATPHILALNTGGLEQTLNLVYIAGDFILFLISLSIALILADEARQFGYKQTRVKWMLIAFAFAALSIFDLVFSYLIENNVYYTGHPIDFLYYVGYLAMGMAAVYFKAKS